jgi:hypothetical protein
MMGSRWTVGVASGLGVIAVVGAAATQVALSRGLFAAVAVLCVLILARLAKRPTT